MITLGEIDRRGYQIVFGKRSFIENEPGQAIEVDVLHAHTSLVDGVDEPKRVLEVAAEAGVDWITLSEHDTNNGNLDFEDLVVSFGMKSRQGFENTSYRRTPGGIIYPVHVLAHRRESGTEHVLDMPKEIMPAEVFNAFIHAQGGVTTAAHPTFKDESVTWAEIERIQALDEDQRFDFIEIENYGVRQVDHAIRVLGPIGWLLRKMGKLPEKGANENAVSIYERHQNPQNNLHAMRPSGGPDSHRAEDVTGTLVGHRKDTNVFDAETEIVILRRRPTFYRPGQYFDFRKREKKVDADWRNKVNQQVAAQSSLPHAS